MSQEKSQKDVVIIAVITELQMFGTGKKSDTQIESPTEKKGRTLTLWSQTELKHLPG